MVVVVVRRWSLFTATLFLLSGCFPADSGDGQAAIAELPSLEAADLAAGEKLRVVATTNIVGDVVAQIGGDAIDLTVLISLGQDPHSYDAPPSDVVLIETAHVVFINGFDLEEGLLAVIEALADRVVVVPISAGIEPRGIEGEHAHEEGEEAGGHQEGRDAPSAGDQHQGDVTGVPDPHVWMDPHNVQIWAENVADVLSALDPANVTTYVANARAYVQTLEELDAYITEQVGTIPQTERKLVTNHESLGYFADRYGFEVVGTVFIGASELASPSAGDMAALVDTIEDEDVRAIFLEKTVSDELASVVAAEVGYEVEVLTLYSGSLGEPGSVAESTIDMLRANVDTIVGGLQ